jgi:hypothetical protein
MDFGSLGSEPDAVAMKVKTGVLTFSTNHLERQLIINALYLHRDVLNKQLTY